MSSMTQQPPVTMAAQAITDAWDAGLKPLKAVHHQYGNLKVTLQGEEATAFAYGIALHYLPNATNRNTRTFVGTYDFHLVKIDGTWKIDQFKFNLKYIDGNMELEKS